MDFKNFFLLLFGKLPPYLRKPIFTIFSEGMKIFSPIICLKMNRGRFSNRKIKEINNINEAVKFATIFQYLLFSINPGQVIFEITKLLEILKDLKPKTILEIGTARGGTLFLFTRIADPEAIIISVDLPGGKFGGGYTKWKMEYLLLL